MDARLLLKNYIDEEKIRYNDIAIATGINLSTLKNGLYNQKISFEKFCKVAVVTDFDIEKNIGSIAESFKMSKTECLDKIEVYKAAMITRTIHKRIESYVAEGNQDTSFAVVCQMQKAVEAADKKKEGIKWHKDEAVEEAKPIPVPEELPELAEAVINHDIPAAIKMADDTDTNKEEEEEAMGEQTNEQTVEVSRKLDKLDIIRDIVRNMRGMQAVEMASLLQAIIGYRDDQDINWLLDARDYLDILIQEQEHGWQ